MSRPAFWIVVSACYLTLLLLSYWSGPHPAEARQQCVRPPHMMVTNECNRIPTIAVPYCPFP